MKKEIEVSMERCIRANSLKSLLTAARLPAAVVVAALAVSLSPLPAVAQAADASVAIAVPSAWATLRSDSVLVSMQVDTALLSGKSVNFKVVRRSGARSSTLFSKSVKVDESTVDAFLGRVSGLPIGGRDFLSVEWSAGTEYKGVVEPIGVVKLGGAVSADNKWVPSTPRIAVPKLNDGIDVGQAAETAWAGGDFSVGGAKLKAGWNASGLFLWFTPTASVPAVEFALDMKCGSNAFAAWADRFVSVSADSAYGTHVSARSVDKDGLTLEESPWGNARTIALTKSGAARLVVLEWSELGIQPSDGRGIGFAAFAKGKGGAAAYPAGASRLIPGTWGGIDLGGK